MYGLDQIGSTLGDFLYAVLHPSVANLPAGFLVLVFAVLMIAALPEGAGEDAFGQLGGGRTDRQPVPDLAGHLGDPALAGPAAALERPQLLSASSARRFSLIAQ
jgi:hypothetical protein